MSAGLRITIKKTTMVRELPKISDMPGISFSAGRIAELCVCWELAD
jgi:hypothetical protein